MIILIDTDTVLDLLLDREPFSGDAIELFSRVERGDAIGLVCALTVTELHRLAAESTGTARARRHLRRLLSVVGIAPVTKQVLDGALGGALRDFERDVVSEAAYHAGARAIVTRDVREYHGSRVPAYLPAEMLEILRAGEAFGE